MSTSSSSTSSSVSIQPPKPQARRAYLLEDAQQAQPPQLQSSTTFKMTPPARVDRGHFLSPLDGDDDNEVMEKFARKSPLSKYASVVVDPFFIFSLLLLFICENQ
jgi:hypothetical protein